MKAKEARKIATTQSSDEKHYLEIHKKITKAAQKGEFFIWFYKKISHETRTKLEKDGYTVGNTMFDRNEILTKIEW